MENPVSSNDIFQFLNQLGDESRALAMTYFRARFHVERKSDNSPVTDADRAIEHRLRELIAERFPSHSIVGEEEGGSLAEGTNWVIDPIDGTKSFVAGIPLFGSLVAMLEARLPKYGLIEIPALSERWIGSGDVALFNGSVCRTSSCEHLHQARLCATDPHIFRDAALEAFEILRRSASITRFGTDCYGYGLLASGHVDLVVEADLEVYDLMAVVPIIEASGGTVTTWSGEPLHECFDGTVIAAATTRLHAKVVEMFRTARPQ
ncbi:3'(2'),5'-bisphosphate nucleotidase [Caballeronia hypogeia]|uniref:3'(2'),5'-bisphosphate nucleotidase n=1 Tax=Caballeronia hypogeia TaxID=1777140 RepID=A0A158CJ28_9BURK|nr:inositol monophosphatase family protein [Caballeronia hypogeia]SAK82282.1 3'(2'),5'-bisphosphate nucleotidase [Caballeronia hypogeia]